MKNLSFPRLFGTALLAGALAPANLRATGDFYEEPLQTLSDYLRLDQLPPKSFEQIRGETSAETPSVEKVDFESELHSLTKKPGPEALASINKMIAAARDQSATALLNLLNDVRDLYSGPATAAESEAYLQWRLDHLEAFGVSFDAAKAGTRADAEIDPQVIADIEKHLAKASPALKPHWMYLRGAADYLSRRVGESQAWFLRVSKEFPKSPRAETALFMAARCGIWRSRSSEYTQQEMQLVASERPKAKKLFDEYFAKFPRGRLLGDALGWYAAFAYDGHDFATALRFYLQQLEMQDHPELHPAAAEMVEKTLSHLASEPRDKALAEVAKHPAAAQALVYLIINTSESDNYNGKIDSVDEVRGWRKAVLPKLAAAIAAEAKLYQAAEWKPRQLAMLAYAASGAGQQDQAVKLLGTAGAAANESDDLLMARGVVFHRAKRPADAVAALQTLVDKFPESPLTKGARLRLALALTDHHQAGEAVLVLRSLLVKPKEAGQAPADADEERDQEMYDDEGASPLLYGLDLAQVRALIDALLNFAPVEELSATAAKAGLDPKVRLQFTDAIAARLLAKEQFAEAKKFAKPEQWNAVADPIEKLTDAAKSAKEPAARAAACLKLGDAWASARGKLLADPLDSEANRRKVFIDFAAEANLRRAESAPFVGATGNYKLELENRDELRHAFNWWLEASDAQPGTPLAAQALWRALQAMPRIADVSPYTVERAAARKWSDTARKLYDRLKTECPDTEEAKRYAVAWDFPAPKQKRSEDDFSSGHRDAANAGIPAQEALGLEETEYTAETREATQLAEAVKSLASQAGTADAASLKRKAEALQKQVRQTFVSLYDARWVNFIDDLVLFFSEADPGAAVRGRYVEMRSRFLNESAIGGGGYDEGGPNKADPDQKLRADIQAALAEPKSTPVADYFEFLDLAVIANHFIDVEIAPDGQKPTDEKEDTEYRSRDYPQLAKATQRFLEKYPRSKKREAALLLHARGVYRASEQIALRRYVHWPEAGRWEGGYVKRFTEQEPFDEKRVIAALDAYDREFPQGRYTAEIRNFRGAVALRMRDWKSALDLTMALLDDKNATSLHAEAARRLDQLFTNLTDERYRADVLAAIKASKRGRELLAKYAAYESDVNPLLYMRGWLTEQLAMAK